MTDQGSPGALGPLKAAARRRDSDEERAVRLAADTLLDKALRRLRHGDVPAARRFVERALALSADRTPPGEDDALAVHLFVWDAVRERAIGAEDGTWLDRVEDETAALSGPAQVEWLAALRALADEDEVGPAAQRDLRSLVGPAVPGHLTFAGVAPAARVDATLRLLDAVRAVTA
jgi:hypothetical protein